MPNPSPTTELCSRIRENRADSCGNGCGNRRPKPSPIANATGGDANPLAAQSRPRRKTIFEVIREETAEDILLGSRDYAAAPFRKDWIAWSSVSKTSKTVSSLVTCSK